MIENVTIPVISDEPEKPIKVGTISIPKGTNISKGDLLDYRVPDEFDCRFEAYYYVDTVYKSGDNIVILVDNMDDSIIHKEICGLIDMVTIDLDLDYLNSLKD